MRQQQQHGDDTSGGGHRILRQAETNDDASARLLLEQAMDRVYAFPANFAGYTAALSVESDRGCWQGQVEVRPPCQAQVTLDNTAVARSVGIELLSMLGQRWAAPFADRDGRYRMTVDPSSHPLGVRVELHGDPLASRYRIANGLLTVIERTAGAQRCTVTILETRPLLDGRLLPIHYLTVCADAASGQLLRTGVYSDRYLGIGGVWLPSERRVLGTDSHGAFSIVLRLSQHALLTTLTLGHPAEPAG